MKEKQAIIEKTKMLFDFNDPTYMPAVKTGWLPDNLEGMTWGSKENGNRTLYLISDDNFRANQRTQLIVLEVKN
ncbi:esterase-like activity of phytase family protein [Dyadobacter aurulentus]|uniref:esterase-like activity of phytase family protein n=1 Tax=Dyadobacter sp. UC 10 TaxID=2605428 RepID=UPI00286DB463|nr:esterase-like activity of phytase family protein [Dyadobacter sp. UC 10]